MLELGSFLNNDRWTVLVGVGHRVHIVLTYTGRGIHDPTDRKSVSEK